MADPGVMRSRLLIDTNLLLVIVVGAVDPEFVGKFKRTRQYDNDDLGLLRQFVARFDEILVTPHILTEASNLAGQIPGDHRTRALEAIASIALRASEVRDATADIVVEAPFIRLGLADAAIAHLKDKGLTVLTDDLDLYLLLSARGSAVVNFHHLRSSTAVY